jgi:hypothetical protein
LEPAVTGRVRSVTFAAAVSLFGLALLACAGLPADDPGGEPSAPAAVTPSTGATGESLEGKFSYDTMDKYVNAILPMITQWMKETWPGMPLAKVIYVPHGAEGPEDCLDADNRAAAYTAASFEYCGAGQVVYVGQDMLYTFYERTGDAGPAVGLAHEFGHHIQQQVGVPSPRSAEESTQHENQADCLAGAWTQYTDKQKWLEYPDDIEDIDTLFPLIGSAEGGARDHGTAAERKQSFQKGFSGGVAACESFYPSVSLRG